MRSLKRAAADLVEQTLQVNIARPWTLHALFEQHHLKQFFDYFKVDCVFDVGANAGQYADMLRSKCKFTGPIISFEPVPAVAAMLRERAANEVNWFVEEVALSSASEAASFNVMAGDQFSSLNRPSGDQQFVGEMAIATEIKIRTATLDAFFDQYQHRLGFKRPFLKMDTQGSDLEVAKGAGMRLQEFVGIQSELSFKPIYENVPTAFEAIEFYRNHGFELSALVPNNAGHFPRLLEMDCICYRASRSAHPR